MEKQSVHFIHQLFKLKKFGLMSWHIKKYGEADFFMNYTDYLKAAYKDYSVRYAMFAALTINYHLNKEKRLPLV